MRSVIAKPVLLGVVLLICSCVAAFGVQFTLTGVSPNNANMGGVYTSPYVATIGNESNVYVICDDFLSHTYIGESWTTDVTSVSSLPSTVKWSGGYDANKATLSQTQAYTIAAYLAIQIINAVAQNNAIEQGYLSFALWGLFTPSALNNLSTTEQAAALSRLTTAQNAVVGKTVADFSNVSIYTWDGGPPLSGSNPPQEFLRVSMAEPSSLGTLLVTAAAVLGFIVVVRKRLVAVD